MARTAGEQLGGVSLAELEYAHRYADHLAVGEPEPSREGFDAARLALIEGELRSRWYAMRDRLKRRR